MLHFHIQNFQTIKEVQLTVSGFTVMLGENNIGKSSTFRAIHGLFNNRSGDGFISLNQPKAQVACTFDDTVITWVKERKTGSRYVLTKNGKTSGFEKVGRSSPEFVSEFGFGPITLKSGKSLDPHFSKQREEPFLLSRSGSKTVLTEFFSEVLKFGTLGKALSNVTKDTRDKNILVAALEKQYELQKNTVASLPNLTPVMNEISVLEQVYDDIYRMSQTISKIDAFIEVDKAIVDLPDFQENFDKRLSLLDRIIKLRDRIDYFIVVDSFSKTILPEIDETPLKLIQLLKLELSLRDWVIPELDESKFKIIKLLTVQISLLDLEKDLLGLGTELVELEKEFDSELKRLGVCPLCER